jgi:hypothetical protein
VSYATWLPDVLRDAGLKVVEHGGWRTRGHGGFADLAAVVWHHDGSPRGNSPGVPSYMIRNWGAAGAQLWVARDGTWHVIASGVAYHAGRVRPGMPTNRTSLGVETDHTTGEAWPPALLASLRVGTAAILRRINRGSDALHFHKTICSPVGRKTDPDGLDLGPERARVGALLTPQQEDDIVASIEELRAVVRDEINRLSGGPRRRDGEGRVVDGDPQTISVADVYTLVEQLAARPCTCKP